MSSVVFCEIPRHTVVGFCTVVHTLSMNACLVYYGINVKDNVSIPRATGGPVKEQQTSMEQEQKESKEREGEASIN